jgi:hypothetical protein
MNLARTDALYRKKQSSLIVFVDELFQIALSGAVLANIKDCVSRVLLFTADQGLLDPALGATDAAPSSLTFGIAAGQSTGAAAEEMIADLSAALAPVIDTSPDPSRIAIIMPPAAALHGAKALLTSGSYAFPQLTALGGSIWGFQVLVSRGAQAIGSPAQHVVAVVDAGRIVHADDEVLTVDSSAVASLSMRDNPTGAETQTSMFQTTARALRVQRYLNYARAANSAVAWFPTTGY